jgi:uncharacterized protein YneR
MDSHLGKTLDGKKHEEGIKLKLAVTPATIAYFKKEWGFEDGDFVRIFTRYGGSSTIHEGFSLGITKEQPKDIALSVVEEGITFFIEDEDIWYLNNYNLTIDFNADNEEVIFNFLEK